MSAIKQALSRLNGAIDVLESATLQAQNKAAAAANAAQEEVSADSNGHQPDMFVTPSNGNGAAIAEKLDSAIEKVEAVLKQGSSA